MRTITLDQFLGSTPMHCLDSATLAPTTATFQRLPAFPRPFIDIRDEAGTLQRRFYTSQAEAAEFFECIVQVS